MRSALETLDLGTLSSGRPGLTESEGGHLAEAAVVCLDLQGHALPQLLEIRGLAVEDILLLGPKVTPRMRRTFADTQEAVEYAAAAVGILTIEKLKQLTVYERARKDGHGFDYFLIPIHQAAAVDEDNFLAQATATMEVSGILAGPDTIRYRIRSKLQRLAKRGQFLPAYVAVTEFSTPMVQVEHYEQNP